MKGVEMLNGNILTVATEDKFEKKGGIFVPTSKKNYKKLMVVSGEDLDKGSEIYVNISVGTDIEIEDNKFTVVNKRDIILIL